MSPTYYEEISGQPMTTNAYLLKTEKMSKEEEETLSEELLKTGAVTNTSFISTQIKNQEESLSEFRCSGHHFRRSIWFYWRLSFYTI